MEAPEHRNLPRPALFTVRTTHFVRLALLGVALVGGAGAFTTYEYYHAPYWNRISLAPDQPVMFSHRHHAGELRIDCRFCHTSVETAAAAGLPPTQTCMTCHSQLFTDTPMLRPVVASAEQNVPLSWSRVSTLPDHVHFNHSVHVAKGIACVSCHGDVADMALTAKAREQTMRECLDCHRDPAPHRVAHDAVFTTRPISAETVTDFSPVHPRPLTNCSTCHH